MKKKLMFRNEQKGCMKNSIRIMKLSLLLLLCFATFTNAGNKNGQNIFTEDKDLVNENLEMVNNFQDEGLLKGNVKDQRGEAIPGVSIMIKGTTTGTITDIDGNYVLNNVPSDAVIVYTFIGMASQEISVKGKSEINVVLKEDAIGLDEVIAIGYGSQRKKEITGSVARVQSESINEIVSADLGSAIQGKVAGVNVVASSGDPGAASNIQIRGITSISGDSEPLYVVDGVPQDVNPRIPNSEIESLDVLKDAASASIYGTRAAAGVILITTKSGKEGSATVNFDATYGINKITSELDLMNANEALYFNQIRERYTAWGGNAIRDASWLNNDTKVPDMVVNDGAAVQTYSLNIAGGQKNFSYNASLGYHDEDGILVNSQYKRINSRVTTNYNKGRVNIRTSIGYNTSDHDKQGGGLLFWAINYQPYLPELSTNSDVIEYADGGSQWQAQALLERLKAINNEKTDRFNGSADVTFEIVKGLKLRSVFGGSITNNLNEQFTPSWTYYNVETEETEVSDPTTSFSRMRTRRGKTWSFNPSLNYNKSFGKHNVTALAAFALDERSMEDFTAEAQGIDDPNLSVLNNGLLAEFAYNGFNYAIRTVGVIGRVLYNYDSKYMLSASVRRDGSSKFGETKRWGTFPSVSLGWNVAQEEFWANIAPFTNQFKIRASYGTTGNESFRPYGTGATIGEDFDYIFANSDAVTIGKAQDEFGNSVVQWETSVQTNLGIDLGFFNNKVSVTADIYNTQKKDMLFPLRLPVSAGIPGGGDVTLNVGDMENKGFEIATNYRAKAGSLNLNFGATYSRNRNKITKIFGDTEGYFNNGGNTVQGDYNNTLASKMQVGYEAGAFFLYETNGVINTEDELAAYKQIRPTAQMGDLIYVDQLTVDTDGDGVADAGDGKITTDDQVYKGSGLPDFEIGFNMSAEYKGFDFSMNWYASVGNEVMNGSAVYAHGVGRHTNLLNMWTPENSESDLPILRLQNHKDDPNYRGNTDLWIEDGSFVRLKQVALGYTLPKRMLESAGIGKCRIYVSAQNPLTFTEYTGYDPEIGGENIIQRGLDRGSYPVFSKYMFGVQLKF